VAVRVRVPKALFAPVGSVEPVKASRVRVRVRSLRPLLGPRMLDAPSGGLSRFTGTGGVGLGARARTSNAFVAAGSPTRAWKDLTQLPLKWENGLM